MIIIDIKNTVTTICSIAIVSMNLITPLYANNTKAISSIKNFGGSEEDIFKGVAPSNDGGFVAVGNSTSVNAGFPSKGGDNAIIVKYDLTGNQQWVKSFGGSGNDCFTSTIRTSDGGYIAVGNSTSTNAGFSNNGNDDAIIVKYNSNGTQQWVQNFGGSGNDYFTAVAQVSDGGFIVLGYSYSTNAGFTNKGITDAVIVKYNSNGTQQWVKNFGGTDYDFFYSIALTLDGGFVVVGHSLSTDAGFTNKGNADAIIVKYNSNGIQQWVQNFGSSLAETFFSVTRTLDGGFAAVGQSKSTDAGFINKGLYDAIIVKYNSSGAQQWVENVGSTGNDTFKSVIDVNGDIIVSGRIKSLTGDRAAIVKYDSSGTKQWSENFGDSGNSSFNAIVKLNDDKIVAVGNSTSIDSGFTNNGGNDAVFLDINMSKPSAPNIINNSNLITISPTISIDEVKEIKYKINDGAWEAYTEAFKPIYNGGGMCKIEVKCINFLGLESDIETLELTKLDKIEDINDINILFKQPHTLSIMLSSNTVDFGEITGAEDVEKNDTITLTVSSSTTYDIKMKAEDDIKGIANNSNVVDLDKLYISTDTNPYQAMSKNYTDLLSNNPKSLNAIHSLNFKLESTLGVKADSYSVPIKITVFQK